jgi:hypothetical protein
MRDFLAPAFVSFCTVYLALGIGSFWLFSATNVATMFVVARKNAKRSLSLGELALLLGKRRALALKRFLGVEEVELRAELLAFEIVAELHAIIFNLQKFFLGRMLASRVRSACFCRRCAVRLEMEDRNEARSPARTRRSRTRRFSDASRGQSTAGVRRARLGAPRPGGDEVQCPQLPDDIAAHLLAEQLRELAAGDRLKIRSRGQHPILGARQRRRRGPPVARWLTCRRCFRTAADGMGRLAEPHHREPKTHSHSDEGGAGQR